MSIKGTVATGVAGGPKFADSRRTSTFLFLILHKFETVDPAFRPSDYLTEAGEKSYAALATTCVRPGATASLEEVLKVWPDHASVPAVEDWPTLRFSHPVFIGTGLADAAALPEIQYGTATAACRAGSIVETHYYPAQDHGGAVNASLVDSVPFVKKLFANQPVAGNCATLTPPPAASATAPSAKVADGQSVAAPPSAATRRPRVVITQDPELDDVNTVVRALLYSTDFSIEGLVYSSASIHFRGDGKGTTQYIAGREYARMGHGPVTSWRWPPKDKEKWIDEIVDAYAAVYANLKVHDPGYPAPAELRSRITWGNVEFDGDYSKDTGGSNLIESLLLDDRPGPLFVTAGGGQSTIARALKSIYDDHARTPGWDAIRSKVSRKLVIIPWGDQDGTNARYIRPNWPDVATWQLAMIEFGYGARGAHAPENQVYLGTEWTREHVSSRGPLGALYRVWGDGKQMAPGDLTDYFGLTGLTADELRAKGYMVWTPPREKGSFISEGDTPTFMNLIHNGLRAYEDGSWGGWGGRRRPDGAAGGGRDGAPVPPAGPDDSGIAMGLAPAGSTANAPPPAAPPAARTEGAAPPGRSRQPLSAHTTLVNARFFAAAQHDFAARLKWSVTPRFADANHAPIVTIAGPLARDVRAGQSVDLRGAVTDPDRDAVTVRWWHYLDAGTYPAEIPMPQATALDTTFQVPADAQPGQTIHVILEATDGGTPTLTRYQRVVLTAQR